MIGRAVSDGGTLAGSQGRPSRGFAVGLVVGVVGVLMLLVGVSSAAAAGTVTRTFVYTGAEQTFVVPPNLFSVNVVAIGGSGGSTETRYGGSGGAAARVTGELSVTPGASLYVEVGQNGANGPMPKGEGGPIGGAECGGASDVRTLPRSAGLSPDTRLLGGGRWGWCGRRWPVVGL